MKGVIAVLDWRTLLASDWYESRRSVFGRLGRCDEDGEWEDLPREGFYAVDLMSGDVWGPFDTETEAVGQVITAITQLGNKGGESGERVLH